MHITTITTIAGGTAGTARIVVGSLLAAAAATALGAAVGAAPADDSPNVFVIGSVEVPAGEPGELDVVLTAPFDRYNAAVIVRNNTDADVGDVEVLATATDAAGQLVGVLASYPGLPEILAPGEWMMLSLGVDGREITADSDIEYWTSGTDERPDDEPWREVPLTITAASLTADEYGDTLLVGELSNPNDRGVDTASIIVACFRGGELAGISNSTLQPEAEDYSWLSVEAGATATFAASLWFSGGTCDALALAASGSPQF